MNKRTRLILLALSVIVLTVIGKWVTGDFNFLLNDFWFTSGFLLLILLSLVTQPHFSKDSNIFVNAVTASISLLLVDQSERKFTFWLFLLITIYLAVSSYVIMLLRNKPLPSENKTIQLISRVNRQIGRPEAIFSAFFLWGILMQFGSNTKGFNALLLYWLIFMLLNLPAIANALNSLFEPKETIKEENALGKIFGVQSKNTFLVKLFDERPESTNIFDFVEFKYSIGNKEKVRKGLIVDSYLLNEEQWIKVLTTSEIETIFDGANIFQNHTVDIVYKINQDVNTTYLDRFIGIVTEQSKIDVIRFIYNSRTTISHSSLLEVYVGNKKTKVLYQIVDGTTKIEPLENKNQTGLIIGEAVQLGTWNSEKSQFEKFGWVPQINSPVYISSHIENTPLSATEFLVGSIPETNYPVIIDKTTAITHHTAIIGVTGTGKSIFARNLIREYLKDPDTNVICIDFTGEYIGKFKELNPTKTISDGVSKSLFKKIDDIEIEKGENYNKDTDNTRKLKGEVSKAMFKELKAFLESESSISIFELPDVANSSGVLSYTKTFFRILFHIAKNNGNFGKRVCLVLEEAHTIVPEWNFSGVSDKVGQPLLNSIAQIALQGRKYNVGLMVIAQRTANVSKTILTQCNTIIAFQVFDKTSSDYLSNYFGNEVVKLLPLLKFRQAIAAGKAFKSNIPLIFEVPFIEEPDVIEEEE